MGKLCCNPVTLSDELCENEYNTLGYMNIEHNFPYTLHDFNTQFYQGKSKSDLELQREQKKRQKEPSQVEMLWSHVTARFTSGMGTFFLPVTFL